MVFYAANILGSETQLKLAEYSLDTIKLMESITKFVTALPPLLQLLLGIFATIGVLRLLMFVVDFIEDKREGKK